MPALVVGGVSIPVAPGSGSWDWNDAIDRRRAFDNTYRASSTGGAARDGQWTTPPVTRANAGIYRGVLQQVAAQMCSGDLIEIPTMCCAELVNESPVKQSNGSLVVMQFALHEVQGKKLLLKYSPGDTITGESFTRSTPANQTDANGQLISKAINVKRDGHFRNGLRALLLEGARVNDWSNPEDLSNGVWTKTRATVTANAAAAPDAAVTADKLVEDSSATTDHNVGRSWSGSTTATPQSWSYFAKAAERTWHRVRSFDRNGVVGNTYVDLVNAVLGAISGAAQTLRLTNVLGTWRRIETTFDSASGASNPKFEVGLATGNNGAIYTGDGTSGSYAWGFQCEIDAPFASSYIVGSRGADFYSLPLSEDTGEVTIYLKFIERGTILTPGARLFEVSNAADADPRYLVFVSGGFYTALHGNGVGTVTSGLAVAPAIGDTVEILFHRFGDGSVDITQSINAATATSGAQTGANAIAPALAGTALWLNSAGTVGSVGFVELQSFKRAAGARSLAEMRAA